MNLLHPLAEGIWTAEVPLRVAGMSIGHRMTVVRLPGNALWVHSPLQWSQQLAGELSELGEVRHLVAPSLFHDLWLDSWREKSRTALLWGAPGLRERHAGDRIHITADLTDDPHTEWSGTLDQVVIGGAPKVNEVVFFHYPSRTLIVADLVFHLRGKLDFGTSILATLNGCANSLAVTRMYRSTIKDRDLFAQSMRKVLAWEFEQIVMGHGEIVTTGARHLLAMAFAWLPSAFPTGARAMES
jgi:hypothetical protein